MSKENRQPILVKLPPALLDRIEDYIRQQPAAPTRTAVIEAAIVRFLDSEDGGKRRR